MIKAFWYESTKETNPLSTYCEANALTTAAITIVVIVFLRVSQKLFGKLKITHNFSQKVNTLSSYKRFV